MLRSWPKQKHTWIFLYILTLFYLTPLKPLQATAERATRRTLFEEH